jgi:hypothetical protein
MIGKRPGVFVSSTFFDLREHRQMLKRFIEDELGCSAFLFEDASFPINPDATTIQNCRDRINNNADVLVLIVGSRYGYIDKDAAKSVTNVEYLTARAKGIPVYVFVDPVILNYISFWRENPTADFSKFVDTPLLFEFVERVRRTDGVWTKEFRDAREIVEILRIQLAYLFQDALDARLKLRCDSDQLLTRMLSGESLRIAIYRPELWEYRLFAMCLMDEVSRVEAKRREHKTGIALGFSSYVPVSEYGTWVNNRLHEIQRAIDQLNVLFERELRQALGPPGTAGNAREIAFVAKQVAAVYESTIDWAQSIRRHRVNKVVEGAVAEFAKLSDSLIEEVERFGPSILEQIDGAIARLKAGNSGPPLDVTLSIRLSNHDRFSRENAAALSRIQSGDCKMD